MINKYFVHKSSFVDKNAEIGERTKIWHFCHILKNTKIGKSCVIGQNCSIGPNVKIGNNCKIQNNVSVYEGVKIEDNVFCGPSCVFTNHINPRAFINGRKEFKKTFVKKGATIGANATILCGNTIGKYAFIGAGTIITKNIKDYSLVYGNPAKLQGYICYCGEKLEFKNDKATCTKCRKRYIKKQNLVKELE